MRDLLKGVLNRLVGGRTETRDESRVVGPYRLVEKLGAGGMGEVWRAEHLLLGRPAAVKLVRPGALDGTPARRRSEWLSRFEREARATALLESPHTVRVFDFGRLEDGSFYYAMELLGGLDLQSLVERFGPVSPARAVYILEQLCASLAEAHEAGLVHRDMKPANVFLSRLGLEHDFVKVLDFGLVGSSRRTAAIADARITAVNEVVGTPSFMAPEMVTGERVDARADVYAIGCVAYWLLTGSHVFPTKGRTSVQIMFDHAGATPERPSSRLGRALPESLEALVMSCLAKEPERRPQSAVELGRCLRTVVTGQTWTEADARRWWSAHLPELASPDTRTDGRATTIVRRPVNAA